MNGDSVPEIRAIWDEARQYIECGNYDRAIESYRYILIGYADDSVAVEYASAYLADLFLTLKKLDLAEEHVREAISLKPQKAGYRYILGFIYSRKRQWNKAISQFEIAVKEEPNNGEYLRGLGWATYSSGDVVKGLLLLREANRLAPDNARILADLAVVSLSSLNVDEARQYAERAVKLDPSDPLLQDVRREVLLFAKRLSGDVGGS